METGDCLLLGLGIANLEVVVKDYYLENIDQAMEVDDNAVVFSSMGSHWNCCRFLTQ